MPKLSVLMAPLLACTALFGSTLAIPLAAASPPPAVSLDSTVKIHPYLQYGATAEPTKVVRVIVQENTPYSSRSRDDHHSSGGYTSPVIERFNVIPAYVTSLAQGDIAKLATNANIRYISPDGPVRVDPPSNRSEHDDSSAQFAYTPGPITASVLDVSHLLSIFPLGTGAQTLWSGAPSTTGKGVVVAMLDSGIDSGHPDLAGHVVGVNLNPLALSPADGYGHGTHVAGIITGRDPHGQYFGVAPNAGLIGIKVADDTGAASESDVLRGLDWVDHNRAAYRIRVLNLSVSAGLPQSYATSPIDAAVEKLWHDGVAVVTSAGNLGAATDAVWYAPGNDPYVITVGCQDDNQTIARTDDSLCPISSRGVTEDGFAKPDLVAPGRKIVSALAAPFNGKPVGLAQQFPERVTADRTHIRLSGTSMAAPMVSGAIALLLERQPGLTPDQIKALLIRTVAGYPGQTDAAGELNIVPAMLGIGTPLAVPAAGPTPVGGGAPPAGGNSIVWDGARWGNIYWDGARWGTNPWDGARWGAAVWDGARWGSAYWDGARWGNTYWDGARWGSAGVD